MLLAQYYDQFFSSHIPWYQRARRELLQEILPRVRSACDLACGTGTTAIELRRRGIKVFRRGSVADHVPPRALEGTKRGGTCRGYPRRHASILLAGARRLGHLRLRCLKSRAAEVRLNADGEGRSSRFASRWLFLL
jgi:hypothetical protein